MRKPSFAAILLGLIPFSAMCFSVALWDRIDPMVMGLPFNLFWLISWMVLTPVCMAFAYRVEAARERGSSASAQEPSPKKGETQ